MTALKIPFIVILAMALTMMLGPFSLDTYLPAFPSIGEDLGVDLQSVSLTVSCYIFALALSQLLGGAFSDRFGRRNVLLSGLLIFSIASLFVASSTSLFSVLLGRMVQAFGAGWAMVSVPALVRDRVSGKDAAKLFSMLGFIMVLAPGVAPSLGGLFLKFSSWRGIFVALALYALFLIPLTYFIIFRKMPKAERKPLDVGMLRKYLNILSVPHARPFILWQAASFSVMMVFITNASFIYQHHFAQSEQVFGLLFAANIVTMLGFNLTNRYLIEYFASQRILRWATVCQGVGVILLLTATLFHWRLAFFLPAMMLTIGSVGAISPSIQSCFLEFFPESGGSAAALLGSAQFGSAGLISAISTRLPEALLVVILTMAACHAVCCSVMLYSGARRGGAV
jgi:DHA1 family bicyclomycin/chloramphenicol resistance-like MFS transporter